MEEALQLSYVPKTTKHRETEYAAILAFLEERKRSASGGTLYVCGGPGTGKTLHADRATQVCGLDVAWLRGTSFGSGEAFARAAGRAVGPGRVSWEQLSARDCVKSLGRRQKVKVLVVDEIDSLVSVGAEAARAVFRHAAMPEHRLALVAIANAIDLPQRSLAATQTVVFEPYKYAQLRSIVEDRLGPTPIFDDKALEFAARKIAANAGDARKVLDLCATALRLAAPDALPVAISHVANAINAAKTCNHADAVANLPAHAKLALKAALHLHHTKGPSFSRHDLNHAYRMRCPGLVQDAAADEALSLLEATGLLQEIDPNKPRPAKKKSKRAAFPPPALRLIADPSDLSKVLQ